MSVYVPTVWVNNQAPSINAANLNHMESGVYYAHIEIEQLVTGEIKCGHAILADNAISIDNATQTTIGGARIWVDSTNVNAVIGYVDAR